MGYQLACADFAFPLLHLHNLIRFIIKVRYLEASQVVQFKTLIILQMK